VISVRIILESDLSDKLSIPLFITRHIRLFFPAYGQTYGIRLEAKSIIFEYIETFYDRKRRYSHIGLVIPADPGKIYIQE